MKHIEIPIDKRFARACRHLELAHSHLVAIPARDVPFRDASAIAATYSAVSAARIQLVTAANNLGIQLPPPYFVNKE